MKNIVLIGTLFFSFIQSIYAGSIITDEWKLPFCKDNDCLYIKGLEAIKWLINDMVLDKTLSEFIQDVIVYLLSFISIVAVIYIIYAWFRIMTSWWNDEAVKKWKKTIIHVIIWITLIWLSYPIVAFILNILEI